MKIKMWISHRHVGVSVPFKYILKIEKKKNLRKIK